MKIEFIDTGMGKFQWDLPEEFAAQLADLEKSQLAMILKGIELNAKVFCTALLSTVGHPTRAASFNHAMKFVEAVYKPSRAVG